MITISPAEIAALGVHPVLGPAGQDWWIEQNPWELSTFLDQLPDIQTVLEIGTGHRAGLSRFLHDALNWTVTTIDVNAPQYVTEGVTYIRGASASVYNLFAGKRFDLVIIDGDHRYEAVKQDYELYAPLADKVVMLHDIAGLRDCDGVAQFWREIAYTKTDKLRKDFHEAIATSRERAGIGWVTK
jgi:hypothetical protein